VPEFIFGKEPNHFLTSCGSLLPKPGKVLAIADGEGRMASRAKKMAGRPSNSGAPRLVILQGYTSKVAEAKYLISARSTFDGGSPGKEKST
jgi:hypothetical protein